MIDENRILRAEIAGLCDALDAAANIATRLSDARSGTESAVLLERAYLAIREMREGPAIIALKS